MVVIQAEAMKGFTATLGMLSVLWLYFNKPLFSQLMMELNDWCESYAFFRGTSFPAISLLDFCGSILACRQYRISIVGEKSWLETLIACTIFQFGGTTLTGLILGQTPSWLMSVTAPPALFLAWWLTFHSPFDVFWRIFSDSRFFLFFMGLGSAFSKAHSVGAWGVDKALYNSFHVNSIAYLSAPYICILCGTLSGCGGGVLYDWLQLPSTKSFQLTAHPLILLTWREREEMEKKRKGKGEEKGGREEERRKLHRATTAVNMQRTFILSTLYFFVMRMDYFIEGWEPLSRSWGHGLLAVCQVYHYILQVGLPDVDVFKFLGSVFLKVTCTSPTFSNNEQQQQEQQEQQQQQDDKKNDGENEKSEGKSEGDAFEKGENENKKNENNKVRRRKR